jgi:hypothetical protein
LQVHPVQQLPLTQSCPCLQGEARGGLLEATRRKELEIVRREAELAARRKAEEEQARQIAELEGQALAQQEQWGSKQVGGWRAGGLAGWPDSRALTVLPWCYIPYSLPAIHRPRNPQCC